MTNFAVQISLTDTDFGRRLFSAGCVALLYLAPALFI